MNPNRDSEDGRFTFPPEQFQVQPEDPFDVSVMHVTLFSAAILWLLIAWFFYEITKFEWLLSVIRGTGMLAAVMAIAAITGGLITWWRSRTSRRPKGDTTS